MSFDFFFEFYGLPESISPNAFASRFLWGLFGSLCVIFDISWVAQCSGFSFLRPILNFYKSLFLSIRKKWFFWRKGKSYSFFDRPLGWTHTWVTTGFHLWFCRINQYIWWLIRGSIWNLSEKRNGQKPTRFRRKNCFFGMILNGTFPFEDMPWPVQWFAKDWRIF